MSDFRVTGGCLCGAVRYTVNAPAKSLEHCHCSRCRKAHGALSAAGALVDSASFHVVEGAPSIERYTSSPGNHRWFCRRCGCQIYMSVDHVPESLYYWPASLDENMHPGHPTNRECHIFTDFKASWDRFDERLPRHETVADGIGLSCGSKP